MNTVYVLALISYNAVTGGMYVHDDNKQWFRSLSDCHSELVQRRPSVQYNQNYVCLPVQDHNRVHRTDRNNINIQIIIK